MFETINLQWALIIVSSLILFFLSPWAKTPAAFFKANHKKKAPSALWLTGSLIISWIFAKSITNAANLGLDYGIVGGVAYAGYYDTTRGAKKTLTDKRGNCCDQAHLVIALFRAADLPARYVHGTCTFSSGPIGHVWAQVLIGDTWVVADPVSSRNSLGVIKNWNINTFTFKSYYTSLPF